MTVRKRLFFTILAIVFGHAYSLDWWQKAVIYQIYPRSFYDSDGDGVGDLNGIKLKADYLKDIGVNGVWISPFFKSPMKDFGYDIENFTEVDPLFGNLDDFTLLAKELKSKGIYTIMDFVPNHSSDKHIWFEKSRRKEEPYTDYYIWVDGKEPNKTVPNNWISVFGGSAWEWCPIRQQYYLHQFLAEQPDLNYRNPKVREEMKNVIKFWLDHHVDGFRIDALKFLFEDPELRDEPLSHNSGAKPGEYDYFIHNMTTSLPEVYDVLGEWREIMTEYTQKDGLYRLVMVEVTDHTVEELAPYYGNATHPLADMPFNFDFVQLKNTTTADAILDIAVHWLNGTPPTKWPNWVLGNHDVHRIASRTDVELVDAFNMITLLLKGTPVTYYGEELGMVDGKISWNETRDPFGLRFGPERYKEFSRDPERTPMQWNDHQFAGFTKGNKTWLPINPDYLEINVENEKLDVRSHLNTYKRLTQLRQETVFRQGNVYFPYTDKKIFSYVRAMQGEAAYVVLANFGIEAEKINLIETSEIGVFDFPIQGLVKVNSHNIPNESPLAELNHSVDLNQIYLGPKQAVVIKFDPLWRS